MSTIEEIHLIRPLAGGLGWLFQLKPRLRRWLRLPGARGLLPAARRVIAVASPVARLSLKAEPVAPRAGSPDVVTVLSANLHHDWPRFRRIEQRLEAVAQLIEREEVDVALLQEVSRTADLRADEWLAGRLGMAYVYSRANGHQQSIGFEEGLAIFSRFPLSAPTLTELKPTSPVTRRLGLGGRIRTDHGLLHLFSVHLGLLPHHNAAQLRQLRQWVRAAAGQEASLIGGDFNSPENSPQISLTQSSWIDTFRRLHPTADGATHEMRWPWGIAWRRKRLDYLFLRPGGQQWQVVEARHLDAPGGPHSDHRAVLARLRPLSS